jgi:hypothetical protein
MAVGMRCGRACAARRIADQGSSEPEIRSYRTPGAGSDLHGGPAAPVVATKKVGRVQLRRRGGCEASLRKSCAAGRVGSLGLGGLAGRSLRDHKGLGLGMTEGLAGADPAGSTGSAVDPAYTMATAVRRGI